MNRKIEKGTKTDKTILRSEKKVKELTSLSFKMWCVATADKAPMSLQRERHTDRWDVINGIVIHKSDQSILHKGTEIIQ